MSDHAPARPTPQDPVPTPRLPPEAAAALLLQREQSSDWSGGLVRALSVFVIGAAVGFAGAALFGPLDIVSAASHPERPGLMEMWVRFGLPLVGLLAIARAALSNSDRPVVTLLATVASVVFAIGLIWAFYPGSRAAVVAQSNDRMLSIDLTESAYSVGANDLAMQLARFEAAGSGDDFMREMVQHNDLLQRPVALPDAARRALQQLLDAGRPKDCPACQAAMRAHQIWDDAAPGILGSSFALCPDDLCRQQLATILLRGGTDRFCVEIVDRREMLSPDLAPLGRLASGRDSGLTPEQQAQMQQLLEKHPRGDCRQPDLTRAPVAPDASTADR